MDYSGAGGKLIHQKNQKQKISWHCPFKFLQNMVYNTTQHPPPTPTPPQPHTVRLLWEGGGEEVEGKQYTRGVENTNMTDSICSL